MSWVARYGARGRRVIPHTELFRQSRTGHVRRVFAAATSTGGSVAVGGGGGGSVRVRELAEGRCTASWVGEYPIVGTRSRPDDRRGSAWIRATETRTCWSCVAQRDHRRRVTFPAGQEQKPPGSGAPFSVSPERGSVVRARRWISGLLTCPGEAPERPGRAHRHDREGEVVSPGVTRAVGGRGADPLRVVERTDRVIDSVRCVRHDHVHVRRLGGVTTT